MSTLDRQTILRTGVATELTRGRTAVRVWTLQVIGSDPPQEVAMGARPVIVGAHRECGLILADPQVSRRHAELSATPEGVRVRDLGSTNGTWWQGSRVTEVVVKSGATVRFGGTSVRIGAGGAPTVPPSPRERFGGLVGSSVAMRELFAVLELASPSDATVLIEGESGTGKELAARALHDHSPRARVPLVVLDCSAISEQLVDSHLFGHLRGAFTGATSDRRGAFVEASGGTLFLDEIGELSPEAQTKLLRALEDQTVQPVGSDKRVKVDTRVVAATHRSLAEMVNSGTFRFDLYYRLAVVHVSMPPLRERPEDIPALVRHFYEGRGVDPGPIQGDNLARLAGHAWPGNVRELRNVLERAWALSVGGAGFAELRLWMQAGVAAPAAQSAAAGEGPAIDATLPFKDAKERWLEQFERRYLAEVFDACAGNITHAADRAGMSRRHMRALLRKHGIIGE